MGSGAVLVLGCATQPPNIGGLEVDEKAFKTLEVPIVTVFYGLIHKQWCRTEGGALFSEEYIAPASSVFQHGSEVLSVIDIEPFFKAGPPPTPEVLSALRKHLLSTVTLISTTVREGKILLDDAGVEVEYPKDMADLQVMGEALRRLGPKYALIKRESINESATKTGLHFVLCGGKEPKMPHSVWENPRGSFGASYAIPPAIAAHLAKGYTVPEAVVRSFDFVGEMLKRGDFFE